MVGPWPLAPHHDHLQYIHHHIHLMQRGQNRGVTLALDGYNIYLRTKVNVSSTHHLQGIKAPQPGYKSQWVPLQCHA